MKPGEKYVALRATSKAESERAGTCSFSRMNGCRIPNYLKREYRIDLTPELCKKLLTPSFWPALDWLRSQQAPIRNSDLLFCAFSNREPLPTFDKVHSFQ